MATLLKGQKSAFWGANCRTRDAWIVYEINVEVSDVVDMDIGANLISPEDCNFPF